MSDASQGPGWWEASDGRWYPPKETDQPPAPGWWVASDGRWYPPSETETHDTAPRPADSRTTGVAGAAGAPSGRHPRTIAEAAGGGAGTRPGTLDALDQIRTRDDASRMDAAAMAQARLVAASRALESLGGEGKATSRSGAPESESAPESMPGAHATVVLPGADCATDGAEATGGAAPGAPASRARINEADLLRKLADLHRAGVLSDVEFGDKIDLVGRLVAGESLVIG